MKSLHAPWRDAYINDVQKNQIKMRIKIMSVYFVNTLKMVATIRL